MASPNLSPPTLLTPADLISDPSLATQIRMLANKAFARSMAQDPEKWVLTIERFSHTSRILEMLGTEGVMSVIYAEDYQSEEGGKNVIACAAAVPWKGGVDGLVSDGREKEEGWEIKAVCVDGDARYAKKGLAIQLLSFLESYLIQKQIGDRKKEGAGEAGKGKLRLWILTAECINGVYWRKRGYKEVRRSVQGQGTWGCRTSFEMVVLVRDVEFEIGG